MAKITPRKNESTIIVKTSTSTKAVRPESWWKARTNEELCSQLLGTASFLKENQQYRYRQASLYARLYSNYPLYGWSGINMAKQSMNSQLPADRPTLNVVQSCIDTAYARITQAKPRPTFLTDNGNYKERKLAKELNNFINGEFYQTKAYELGGLNLRDGMILGSGLTKVFKSENKVKAERRLLTEILVDPNDGLYGCPRQLYEVQLVDRYMLEDMFPGNKSKISSAEQAYPDTGEDSSKTISDQVIVVEGWHLPSGSDAGDGRHAIVCSSGVLLNEEYKKMRFPFTKQNYSDRVLGMWGQGLAEQLMGTQSEINKLLKTISESIHLVGIPFVWIEEGSKVVKAHINNQVGRIGTYRGTKPSHEVAPCMPQEVYAQLQRLVDYAYQQSGVSSLAAVGQKPAGLNSGEAIRNYDDIQSDRFAATQKKYSGIYEDLAYLMFDTACDIAKETGSYKTVYPNKNAAKQIDLPAIDEEIKQRSIIQCFDSSALPRDPAGRLQKITEMIQSGMIDIKEGRRLLDFPDLDQVEQLANAAEERIYQALDKIVDDGKYTPPDPFMDLQLALTISVQYYNLYVASQLEEDKAQLLRTFNTQVKALITEASQPAPMAPQGPVPQALPEALPTSPLVPNAVQGVA